MSFKDVTDAKVLGMRFFRPYSDVPAEMELRLDYLLAVQPEVGRDYLPIHKLFEQHVHKDVKHHHIVGKILRALPKRMDRVVWKGQGGVIRTLRRYEDIRNIATGLTRSTSRDFV
ncbi:hypothetical protein OKW35_003655 [Paraburkholderia sp. MM5477-R1]